MFQHERRLLENTHARTERERGEEREGEGERGGEGVRYSKAVIEIKAITLTDAFLPVVPVVVHCVQVYCAKLLGVFSEWQQRSLCSAYFLFCFPFSYESVFGDRKPTELYTFVYEGYECVQIIDSGLSAEF